MHKKGIWRIIEAIIGVLLVTGALLIYSSRQAPLPSEDLLFEQLQSFLREISQEPSMRETILADNSGSTTAEAAILTRLKERLPSDYIGSKIWICNVDDSSCQQGIGGYSEETEANVPPQDTDIYTESRYISATLSQDTMKYLRVSIWRKA